MRGNVSEGLGGMWKSVDGGKTWKNLGLLDARHIINIIVHPTDPQTVWVGVMGHLFGPNTERGVFKTTDGGQTWADVSAGLPDSPAQSVYIDNSVAPNRIFVGTDTAGLFSREKTGTSFTAFGKGLPSVQITGIERAGLVLAIATYGKGMYQIPLTVEEKVAAPVVVGNAPSGPSARARANARSAR